MVTKSDRCYATYHGDVAPVLMVLDAEAVIAGPDGVRRIKLAELYRENGADHLTLGAGEVLAAVVLPPPGDRRAAYAKARIRDAIDFPLAGVAVALRRDGDVIGDIKVAITGTNSAPLAIATGDLIGRAWDGDAAAILARSLRKRPMSCAPRSWGEIPPAGDAGPGPAARGYPVESELICRRHGGEGERRLHLVRSRAMLIHPRCQGQECCQWQQYGARNVE